MLAVKTRRYEDLLVGTIKYEAEAHARDPARRALDVIQDTGSKLRDAFVDLAALRIARASSGRGPSLDRHMGETVVREQRVVMPHAPAATQVGHAAFVQHDGATAGFPDGCGHPLAHLTTAQRMVIPYQHRHPAAQYDETPPGSVPGNGSADGSGAPGRCRGGGR
jgi:hypothetical protein